MSKTNETTRYEVRTYTICEGWVNCWYEDDMPQTFASIEDAQAEIDEFFDDIEAEIQSGERDEDEGYDRDDFRIVPVEDSSTDDEPETKALNAYEAKQVARRERYEQRARDAEQRSQSRYESAKAQVDGIPFGQPILVGHHSEGKHRRAIAKCDNHMRASIEESDKADYYASKAASVGSGGISSDDPDAITKLETKLMQRVEMQEAYKRINKAWRAFNKLPDSTATLKTLKALSDAEREMVTTYEPQYSWEKGPAQDYQLKNNNAEIRRLKKRIEGMKAQAERTPAEPIKGEGFEIVENVEANRIQILFDGKPSKDIRDCLKSNGFRWAPSQQAWQRQLNNAGRYAASRFLAFIQKD